MVWLTILPLLFSSVTLLRYLQFVPYNLSSILHSEYHFFSSELEYIRNHFYENAFALQCADCECNTFFDISLEISPLFLCQLVWNIQRYNWERFNNHRYFYSSQPEILQTQNKSFGLIETGKLYKESKWCQKCFQNLISVTNTTDFSARNYYIRSVKQFENSLTNFNKSRSFWVLNKSVNRNFARINFPFVIADDKILFTAR